MNFRWLDKCGLIHNSSKYFTSSQLIIKYYHEIIDIPLNLLAQDLWEIVLIAGSFRVGLFIYLSAHQIWGNILAVLW